MNHTEQLLFRSLQGLGVRILPQAHIGTYVVDFLFPDYKVVVEADSRLYHEGQDHARHDRERDLALQVLGYLTVHVWTDDVRRDGGAERARKHVLLRMFRDRRIALPRFRGFYARYHDEGTDRFRAAGRPLWEIL